MAGIDREQLLYIAKLVMSAANVAEALAAIRHAFPQLHALEGDLELLCDEVAALSLGWWRLFLCERVGEAWQLTPDPQRAAAVMLVHRPPA